MSQDVDVVIPVTVVADVKERLARVDRLVPSDDEPSVWVPSAGAAELIEVNFIGSDPAIVDPVDTYERPDRRSAPRGSLVRVASPCGSTPLARPISRGYDLFQLGFRLATIWSDRVAAVRNRWRPDRQLL